MTQMPPDLGSPYDSEQDRQADHKNLTAYWSAIDPLRRLAEVPDGEWPQSARAVFATFPAHGRDEDPAARLRRWTTFYGEELALIRDVRNRLVLSEIVTDPELLGATWLARQVLATLAGIPPSRLNPDWARSVAGQLR